MNVLMVWELGAGLGHTIPLAAIGAHFIEKGHNVSYALRSLKTAEIAGISSDVVYAAPVMSVMIPKGPAAYDCVDMLLIRGYGRPNRLNKRLKAWFDIFDKVSPDVIITDHAPTARLAAHIAGITSHAIGNGFAVPPLSSPVQPFKAQQNHQPARQQLAERQLNNITNAVLRQHGLQEVERAVDLYFGGETFLITFEELDNYYHRPAAKYYGPPYTPTIVPAPIWPVETAAKAFVYLYPDAPVLPKIIKSLEQQGISTLVYTGSRTRSAELESLSSKTVAFTDQPLSLFDQKVQCDLVICQGGSNTMVTALLQGMPLLTFPQHIEQNMSCSRLKSLGLAEVLNKNSSQQEIDLVIRQCLNNAALQEQAGKFAQKYKDFDGEQVPRTIAEEILSGM